MLLQTHDLQDGQALVPGVAMLPTVFKDQSQEIHEMTRTYIDMMSKQTEVPVTELAKSKEPEDESVESKGFLFKPMMSLRNIFSLSPSPPHSRKRNKCLTWSYHHMRCIAITISISISASMTIPISILISILCPISISISISIFISISSSCTQ